MILQGVGFGLESTKRSLDYHDEVPYLLGVIGTLAVLLYIFDVQYWTSIWGYIVQSISYTLVSVLSVIALLLLRSDYPYGPICIFTILVPLHLMTIKTLFYSNELISVFVGWSSLVLMIMSAVVSAVFLGWALSADDHEWSTKSRVLYADQAGCEPVFDEDFPQWKNVITNEPCFFIANKTSVSFSGSCNDACADVYEECLSAFIIWANPLLAALNLWVLGSIFKFLKPNNPSRQEKVVMVGKVSAVVFFIFWVFASLSGAGTGLSGALIAFALAMFVGAGIVITAGAVMWIHR